MLLLQLDKLLWSEQILIRSDRSLKKKKRSLSEKKEAIASFFLKKRVD
ncbi:hypothetical protein H6F52_13200 [Coleofasciculus sp. FACHB-542]|nr:hypothetical protein [Coleofasciculus sp. FACHB-542]